MMSRPDPRSSATSIDILHQSPLWKKHPTAEKIIRQAVEAAAATRPAAAGEVSVVLTDDEGICALNKQWRGIDKATNVLSFPAIPGAAASSGQSPIMLGDIVLAYETLQRECEDERKDFLHHLAHLCVHGFLHLIGYDHETETDAESMERLESAILARLDVPDPYLERDLRDA